MKKLLEWKPVRFGLEVGELYFSKRVSRSAAELAYFLILTFFPVLICINAFIGLLHLDINAVLEAASPFLPRETLGILGDYIQYITGNQSPALLAAGGIMTLFSASAAFRALMNIMEDLYGRKSYAGVWRIAASVAFSVLFLLTIYLALVVLLTGGWLFHLVERLFRLETVTLPWDWQWFRFLLLFLLVFFVPWSAICLTDYYLISKGALDIPALSDPHQRYGFWNLYAITLYIVGVLIQLPFIENPLFHGSLTWIFAGNDVSWIIGWFGTGVLYYALRRFDRRSLPAQSLFPST